MTAKKSAKLTKKTLTKTKPKPKSAKGSGAIKVNTPIEVAKPVENPSVTLAPPSATSTAPIRAATQIKIPPTASAAAATSQVVPRINRDEQTAAQLAKFPKILPAPVVSNVVSVSTPAVATAVPTSPILASLTSPVANIPSHQILSAALKAQPVASASITPATPVMQFQTNPVKSSPILASQLQSTSPICNPLNNHASNIPPMTSTPNQKLPFKLPSIQNVTHVKMRHSSEDDELESSSDDEFEAIEPTIGFSTTPSTPMAKTTNQKVTGIKASVGTYTSSRTLPTSVSASKVEPAKTKVSVSTTPKAMMAVTTSMHTPTAISTVKYSNVHLNKILSQPPQSTVVSPSPNQHVQHPQIMQQKINVVRLVAQPKGTTALKNYPGKAVITANMLSTGTTATPGSLAAIQTSGVQTIVQTSSTVSTPKSSPLVSPLTKMLPITVNIQQPNKTSSVRPVMPMGAPNTAVTLAGRQVTLNGPVSSIISVNSSNKTTVSVASTSMPNTAVTSSAAGLQMLNLLSQSGVIDTIGNDLNLNLELPVNSLNDGGGVTGEDDVVELGGGKFAKLPDMEKIDELSVLDGNPFDSIPNLSDELDGLDLDLVDGLCDFE